MMSPARTGSSFFKIAELMPDATLKKVGTATIAFAGTRCASISALDRGTLRPVLTKYLLNFLSRMDNTNTA